ncbi:hypothetical protein [Burkholderia ubonensis]|uniref:hypothetical protein n=1 Tax=Burkholderia ubonensis TaxID=101571 RepID=UPI0012F74CBB|nr:hypothetical protein [Burkholderia ubonensis]
MNPAIRTLALRDSDESQCPHGQTNACIGLESRAALGALHSPGDDKQDIIKEFIRCIMFTEFENNVMFPDPDDSASSPTLDANGGW